MSHHVDSTWRIIREALGEKIVVEAENCGKRLMETLGKEDTTGRLSDKRVLVACGGGKDSIFTVAFVRFVQLALMLSQGETFELCVATNRHAGMPQSVMENLHRAYTSLKMYDDPRVELVLIDGMEVTPFNVNHPIPWQVIARDRQSILMTGHLCHGEARPTFCNACNLNMASSFGIALAYNGGADLVITGDSPKEQLSYLKWLRNITKRMSLKRNGGKGFSALLEDLNCIATRYFESIYGPTMLALEPIRHSDSRTIQRMPRFFSVYEYTEYKVDTHWDFLTNSLGFQFDDQAFNFTESDCFNPALMAHLHGMRAQYLDGQPYEKGLNEYIQFAVQLMMQKQIPEFLINKALERYADPNRIELTRQQVTQYAKTRMNLTDDLLICMVFSPFANQGKCLESYLLSQYPNLLEAGSLIHKMLASNTESEHKDSERVWKQLAAASGLSLQEARHLYKSELVEFDDDAVVQHSESSTSPLLVFLEGDPCKAKIEGNDNGSKRESRKKVITGR